MLPNLHTAHDLLPAQDLPPPLDSVMSILEDTGLCRYSVRPVQPCLVRATSFPARGDFSRFRSVRYVEDWWRQIGLLGSHELLCDVAGTVQLGQHFSDAVLLFKRSAVT